MPRHTIAPIVRPSDLKGTVASYVAEAIRTGRARLVGFESQGDALRLLEAREATKRPYVPDVAAHAEPVRSWASLADLPVRAVFADEVDAYPAPSRATRGVGVTGPSGRGA